MKLFTDDGWESVVAALSVGWHAPSVDVFHHEDPVAAASIESIGGVPGYPCLVHMDRVLAVSSADEIIKLAREYESKQ